MSRRRQILAAGAAAIGLALAYATFGWYLPLRALVDIGAGTLSKQMCSCIYVANRSAEDCRADQFESLDPIPFEVDAEQQRVSAGIPLLGRRTAVHRAGFGCAFE